MKSVLISIQSKWVEKIASGEKTIEVRKTRPKLETQFKCYIYCTKKNKHYDLYIKEPKAREEYGVINRLRAGQEEVIKMIDGYKTFIAHGKVIGEFVCDKITDISVVVRNCNEDYNQVYHNDECKGSCLTWKELQEYGKGKTLYGWHISALKIYDKPKELFDFANYDKYQVCKERNCFSDDCWICPNNAIVIRPPQSWCYIELLGE